ncbi:hypothetical protein K504DRAFT_474675 [Pleomassaria siparia CBS 279.74]|uniref:HRQ family protein 2 n=1 Tax=Pleomassaria siparia CBS 279.74 TaxID=1314801 RepID=A0A6G1KH95_9PLEO|nr:hypothetical protein K504DRAFT_474675 [Pleomassaria siparia CBS 279.74]
MMQSDLLPQACLLLVVGALWYMYRRTRGRRDSRTLQSPVTSSSTKDAAQYSEASYYQIEPLADFDLDTAEPIKIRPFKPKYHLTMALENIGISDLVAMDKTYKTRIALRRHLIANRAHDVLALTPTIEPSVLEFYTWITSTYLPQRFPTVFTLSDSKTSLKNLVTDEVIPLTPTSAHQALSLMGAHIDNDFLFLLPTAEEGKYTLEGFITCFPNGFDTRAKLGLKLVDIHGPVPGYKAKLEKSMDRFFSTLPVGKVVRRVNWGITTHGDLFGLSGNHTSPEEAERLAEKKKKKKDNEADEWNIDTAVLRCERQTLHRLPGTRALVFAFKTYQYALRDVKEEGSGEELASAIDGLGKGSTPEMRVYKSAVVWGERAKRFLRGEDEAVHVQ